MPRSRSTAFFRMMAERGDFQLLHEPFSNLADFGSVKVANREVDSEARLLTAIRGLAESGPVFMKDTTDERYPGLLADSDFLGRDAVHTFLIRHPKETIASYFALNPRVRLHQIGAESQYEIYQAVAERNHTLPTVIDAADLMVDPPAMVAAYCAAIGIPFIPDALTWQPGERSEWQPTARWHAEASSSSGFMSAGRERGVDPETHPVLSGYLRHHLPFYTALREWRLQPYG